MPINFPVHFDHSVLITYGDGTYENAIVFPTSRGLVPCTFDRVSGRDSNGVRFTNVVGFDGNSFLKECPNCHRIKPANQFGASGRVINGQRRDQSNCNECRASY